LDAFGDQVEAWISDSLSHPHQIEVITATVDLPIHRLWASNSPATQQDRLATLANETRAGTVITGSFFQTGDQLEISVEVTDARSGQLRWALGPVTEPMSAKDHLARTVGARVVRAVNSLVTPSPTVPGARPQVRWPPSAIIRSSSSRRESSAFPPHETTDANPRSRR
jgi:TolB-like protein